MYRKYGKDSLWVRSHIDARIPEVDAKQLIPVELAESPQRTGNGRRCRRLIP